MMRKAVIFSKPVSQGEDIFNLINPLGLYDEIRTCRETSELEALLTCYRPEILFSSADSFCPEEPETIATLEELATRFGCFMCFFTVGDPQHIIEKGLLPTGTHCLNHQIAPPQLRIKLASATIRDGCPVSGPLSVPQWKTPQPLSRFAFDRLLTQELSRSDLTGRPFILVLIDLQPASKPTPTSGHSETTMQLAIQAIASEIRTSDLFCRYQHDRLALLLPETSAEMAERAIDRIRKQMPRLLETNDPGWRFQMVPAEAIRPFSDSNILEQLTKTASLIRLAADR